MARTLAEMIAPTTADPDVTLTALDVFEGKSKDADDAMEYGIGLSQEELLDIAMSLTPISGSVKTGKAGISFLKGLLGKAKSKAKFPVGYGEVTKDVGSAIKRPSTSTYRLIDEMESVAFGHPERATEIEQILLKRFGGAKKLSKAIDDYYKVIDRMKSMGNAPTGMRKVGVRVKD